MIVKFIGESYENWNSREDGSQEQKDSKTVVHSFMQNIMIDDTLVERVEFTISHGQVYDADVYHDSFNRDTRNELSTWWYGINFGDIRTNYENGLGFDPFLEHDASWMREELAHVNHNRDDLRKELREVEDALLELKEAFNASLIDRYTLEDVFRITDHIEECRASEAKQNDKHLPF